jgi:hypothetical protein
MLILLSNLLVSAARFLTPHPQRCFSVRGQESGGGLGEKEKKKE